MNSTTPVKSGKAVASLILGLASFLLAFLSGVPAIVFGILALQEIGRNSDQVSGRGMAIAGIILGAVASLLWLGVMAIVGMLVLLAGTQTDPFVHTVF